MTAVLTFIACSVLGYVGYAMFGRYMAATGTPRERMCAAVNGSATVIVSYFNAVLVSGGYLLLDVPGLREEVQKVVPTEQWPFIAILWTVLSAYVARRRTLQ